MLLALDKFLPAHRHPIEAHIFLAHTPLAVTLFFYIPSTVECLDFSWSVISIFIWSDREKGRKKRATATKKNVRVCGCLVLGEHSRESFKSAFQRFMTKSWVSDSGGTPERRQCHDRILTWNLSNVNGFTCLERKRLKRKKRLVVHSK